MVNASDVVSVKQLGDAYFQPVGDQNIHPSLFETSNGKDFEMVTTGTDETLNLFDQNTLQTQDSFGMWMKYIVNESPGGLRDLPPVGPMSTDHASGSPATMEQSLPQEKVFSITDVSPAWASSKEETKVILIGHFHEGHTHLASSTLYCVFGDLCAPAEMVQVGVFRYMARPQTPGLVTFYLTLAGNKPISQVLSFEYWSISISNKNNGLDLSEADESKWEDLRIQI
ncbi:calmodulin-binding transcription activator 6-like [Magnolia sinica]|uniref:calmodulin-binding transcription activator 6-like n=1 Tax=Magnolia sinica TaxID=86752 RepID=UPI002657FB52|nr:calmodulin-binding transcription activator 6-like [Magnolia sinica]